MANKSKIHIIMTVGIPASGKSTWAKQFIIDNPTYRRVNRDEIRKMINSYVFTNSNENQVSAIEYSIIEQFIRDGHNIVIDNCNLNPYIVNALKSFIEMKCLELDIEVSFEYKEFPVWLATAIERDKKRSEPVGEKIIKRFWKAYEIELRNMIERNRVKYIEDENLPHAILVDIDGTLAKCLSRRIHDEKLVGTDIVNNPVRLVVNMFDYSNSYSDSRENIEIIIFSGRKDSCRVETEKWLSNNHIYYDELFMRPADDNRPDTIVKSEMFEKYIRGKYYCDFVIDDRIDVCNMYVKEKGLFLFCVNQDPYCENKF